VQGRVTAQAARMFDRGVTVDAFWSAMLRKAWRECPGFDT